VKHRIDNKVDFYRLASLGLCGNTPVTWNNFDDYWEDKEKYPYIGLRRTAFAEKKSYPRMHHTDLEDVLMFEDIDKGTYVITEVPDPSIEGKYGLQGEFTWMTYFDSTDNTRKAGWVLYYANVLGYMRKRLAESGQHAFGMKALNILRSHCSSSEYQELQELFDFYTDYGDTRSPFPVIEFAVMNHPFGRLHRNTTIWEIRKGY